MKSFYKHAGSVLCMIASTLVSHAQTSASSTISTTVVTPITLEKTADLSFGNLSVVSTSGGTVVLDASGARSNSGGVTLPCATGAISHASFTITGSEVLTCDITLPSSITLVRTAGTETMTASGFTSTLLAMDTLNSGSYSFAIGATLNVAAAQPRGTYTSSDFNVTVNYN